jgi:hypothetical protein
VSTSIPTWLGAMRIKGGLGHGERIIRITSGSLAGQLAIVCPSDPDTSGARRQNVYTQADWEQECNPSLAFDDDGDLVWYRPDGTLGINMVAYGEVKS